MAFIYVRDSDQVVVSVQEEQSPVDAHIGITVYEAEWDGESYNKYKVIRNEDGSFTNTMELLYRAEIERNVNWIDLGKEVLAEQKYRNDRKNLTDAQRALLIQTYQQQIFMLSIGELALARRKINSTVFDGVLMTNDDKTAMLAQLDDYLSQ